MNSHFHIRLKELRKNIGMSTEELGRLSGVSKQSISRYENGIKTPSSLTLLNISKALNVHPSYFFGIDNISISINNIKFREEGKISNLEIEREEIENICINYLNNLFEIESVLEKRKTFENPLKGLRIKSRKDVEKAAKQLRRKWRLGYAPISEVTQLVEGKGVYVIEVEIFNDFSGLSGMANEDIPFIVINSNNDDIARKRFTVLHELGHITLEFADGVSQDFEEKLCDHFAGAVLLVDDSLAEEIGRNRTMITLDELVYIKKKYGISIQAIIMRAKVTKVISQNTSYQWWNLYTDWKDNDVDFGTFNATEKPVLFYKLIVRGVNEQKITWNKASELTDTKIDILKSRLRNQPEFYLN